MTNYVRPQSTRPSWADTWLTVADAVAQRSLCERDKVGAVIVSRQERIVATGYNGPPSGFPRTISAFGYVGCSNWCTRSQTLSKMTAEAAESLIDPTYGDCPSIHAEMNAIAYANRQQMENGTIYVSSVMCFSCAKVVANSGITRVVMRASDEKMRERDGKKTVDFLTSCRVQVRIA